MSPFQPLQYLLFIFTSFFLSFQIQAQDYLNYEVSAEHPYGLIHPDAPKQLADYAPMIGRCDCSSVRRNTDGSWQDTVPMVWQFKYILNGKGVQDETLKADGFHSGSIRQFNSDSLLWYVSYYASSSPVASLSTWSGKKEGKDIVLYLPQPSPTGVDGFSRLTFYDLNETGYKWIGEWVNVDQSIVYPFWRIDCRKQGW